MSLKRSSIRTLAKALQSDPPISGDCDRCLKEFDHALLYGTQESGANLLLSCSWPFVAHFGLETERHRPVELLARHPEFTFPCSGNQPIVILAGAGARCMG